MSPTARMIISMPQELVDRVKVAAERDRQPGQIEANVSGWVRAAIEEKLARQKRGGKQ